MYRVHIKNDTYKHMSLGQMRVYINETPTSNYHQECINNVKQTYFSILCSNAYNKLNSKVTNLSSTKEVYDQSSVEHDGSDM